jgi:cobalt-zinc-cadmium efflux system protein
MSLNPDLIGQAMASQPSVTEIHDLHIWDVTSGMPALSAHILVDPTVDCHAIRRDLKILLRTGYDIRHTTMQVDHALDEPTRGSLKPGSADSCEEPHGLRHYPPKQSAARNRQNNPPRSGNIASEMRDGTGGDHTRPRQ